MKFLFFVRFFFFCFFAFPYRVCMLPVFSLFFIFCRLFLHFFIFFSSFFVFLFFLFFSCFFFVFLVCFRSFSFFFVFFLFFLSPCTFFVFFFVVFFVSFFFRCSSNLFVFFVFRVFRVFLRFSSFEENLVFSAHLQAVAVDGPSVFSHGENCKKLQKGNFAPTLTTPTPLETFRFHQTNGTFTAICGKIFAFQISAQIFMQNFVQIFVRGL